jgi:hypothetical protein
MASSEAVLRAATEIGRLLEEYNKEGGAVVKIASELVSVLTQHGLAWKTQLHSSQVGVHPKNRDGLGVIPAEVHEKLANIVGMGFVWEEVQNPMCSEVSPLRDTEIQFNIDLAEASGHMLAPIEVPLRTLAFRCTHTNQGIRAACAGVESKYPVLCGSDGRMSASKLSELDKSLGEAIKSGLHWTVISWRVEEQWPNIIEILQEAGNAPAQIQKGESEIQITMKIAEAASKQQKKNGSVDWKYIQTVVARSRPACIDDIPDLAEYVRLFAGGVDFKYQRELASFVTANAPSRKMVVRGNFYKKLGAVNLGVENPVPQLRTAILKAMYIAGSKHCNPGGEVKLLSSSDLSAMQDKLKDAAQFFYTARMRMRACQVGL